MCQVVIAIFYVTHTGCPWRYPPREYPPWQIVYRYFRAWRISGVWERIHDRLRSLVRQREGRESQPTAAIIDSQSVKTTDRGGAARGFDAGKLTFGRKRHILVDTLGLLLLVVVHSAGLQDRDGARKLRPSGEPLLQAQEDLGRQRLRGSLEGLRVLARNQRGIHSHCNDQAHTYSANLETLSRHALS